MRHKFYEVLSSTGEMSAQEKLREFMSAFKGYYDIPDNIVDIFTEQIRK